jgi:hypothetical protein
MLPKFDTYFGRNTMRYQAYLDDGLTFPVTHSNMIWPAGQI